MYLLKHLGVRLDLCDLKQTKNPLIFKWNVIHGWLFCVHKNNLFFFFFFFLLSLGDYIRSQAWIFVEALQIDSPIQSSSYLLLHVQQ